MGAQPRDRVAQSVERRMQAARRGARSAGPTSTRANVTLEPLREEGPQASQRHAAHVSVGRIVVDEVVPEHAAAGSHPAPHRRGQNPLLTCRQGVELNTVDW